MALDWDTFLAALLRLPGHRIRQLIEVVNAQLQGQFAIERTLAKTLWGLVARGQAKLAAHTSGVYLNGLRGRPPLALKTLVV